MFISGDDISGWQDSIVLPAVPWGYDTPIYS